MSNVNNSFSYLLDRIYFAISKLTEEELEELKEAAKHHYSGGVLPKDFRLKAAKLGLAYKTGGLKQITYEVLKGMKS